VTIACGNTVRVGVLQTGEADTEQDSLIVLLSLDKDLICETVDITKDNDYSKYDVLWYHRSDTSALSQDEIKAGAALSNFMNEGGQLILSDDAVRLLNSWGIEKAQIEVNYYDAADYGYGRKVGFHSFREHPLFDGLNGGAYVWHGMEDNKCRIFGYNRKNLPETDSAKVIGIFWEYIYYHPELKVIWEEPVGKGRVLAIGGLLNYSKPNFNRVVLERFTFNCVNYLTGKIKNVKERFWDYKPVEVVPKEYNIGKVSAALPEKWGKTPGEALKWAATNEEVDISSKRTMLVSKEKGGIYEIWTHPFMSLKEYSIRAKVNGSGELILLEKEGDDISLSYNSLERNYVFGGFHVREIITSSIDSPSVVAHYEWDGAEVSDLLIDFKCDMRYMWPYDSGALGSLYYGWSEKANAFVVTDANEEFISIIGSNVKGEVLSAGSDDNTNEALLKASIVLSPDKSQACDVVFVAGNEGKGVAVKEYKRVVANPKSVFYSSQKYYKDYLSSHTTIETPDSFFNEAYRWALISAAQFEVETPGLGTSLMAGYSSSHRGWGGGQKVSGRPGYAWYFGRDAVLSAFAFLETGDFEVVKNVLKTLIKYQRVDGKIYHELTSSGSAHYDASDATPFFVVLMGQYLRATGDSEFVKVNMPAILKAMKYAQSTDVNKDHLIENANVGHGILEGGEFFGSVSELHIVGLWAKALEETDYLLTALNVAEHNTYKAEAAIVRDTIDSGFWNIEGGYYNYGKLSDGGYTNNLMSFSSFPVYLGVTDRVKSRSMMKKLSTLYFKKDWGFSTISDSCKVANNYAYSEQNVWPLHTGWVTLANYKVGRYLQGFSGIMANLMDYASDTHGRIPEVLRGGNYASGGITRHQCWSETMAIHPAIEGLIGFVPDALNNNVSISPRLPYDWDTLSAKNLHCGETKLCLTMKKTKGVVRYVFDADKAINISFNPTFPLESKICSMKVNGKDVKFQVVNEEEYTDVECQIAVTNKTTVEIELEETPAPLPTYFLPERNAVSTGVSILEQSRQYNNTVVKVQGQQGTEGIVKLYVPNGLVAVDGAKSVKQTGSNVFEACLEFEKSNGPFVTTSIVIHSK